MCTRLQAPREARVPPRIGVIGSCEPSNTYARNQTPRIHLVLSDLLSKASYIVQCTRKEEQLQQQLARNLPTSASSAAGVGGVHCTVSSWVPRKCLFILDMSLICCASSSELSLPASTAWVLELQMYLA